MVAFLSKKSGKQPNIVDCLFSLRDRFISGASKRPGTFNAEVEGFEWA